MQIKVNFATLGTITYDHTINWQGTPNEVVNWIQVIHDGHNDTYYGNNFVVTKRTHSNMNGGGNVIKGVAVGHDASDPGNNFEFIEYPVLGGKINGVPELNTDISTWSGKTRTGAGVP